MSLLRAPENATSTIRLSSPHPGIYAYYDGRTGSRYYSESPNWLDDGAFSLGVATYSLVSGTSALLYDAGITREHAAYMLDHVRGLGVTNITVVYSHVHNDHIAGAGALWPAPEGIESSVVIAHTKTREDLADPLTAEEVKDEDPPLEIVLPGQVYEKELELVIGEVKVKLVHFNVHSPDSTVVFVPESGVLFAGDTLEDTATYLSDESAGDLKTHVRELRRMQRELGIKSILPAHGCPEKIARGGYEVGFIEATVRYLEKMDEGLEVPKAWGMRLQDVVRDDVERGALGYFEAYEKVHKENVETLRNARRLVKE